MVLPLGLPIPSAGLDSKLVDPLCWSLMTHTSLQFCAQNARIWGDLLMHMKQKENTTEFFSESKCCE